MITCKKLQHHSSIMVINGYARCLFEQSGTFRDAFRSLGISSVCYDISDSFRKTDFVVDLFEQIELAYEGSSSVFDSFSVDDLLLAFFPCVHFCGISQTWFSLTHRDYRNWDYRKIFSYMISKNSARSHFYEVLLKLVFVCLSREFRLILENPYSMQTFLRVFLKPPDIVDYDRSLRGDFMSKPTAYWFFGCSPVYGLETFQKSSYVVSPLHLNSSGSPGVCSIDRSIISFDYACNFIRDYILGIPSLNTQLSLF